MAKITKDFLHAGSIPSQEQEAVRQEIRKPQGEGDDYDYFFRNYPGI
jgi:hypothetical protein